MKAVLEDEVHSITVVLTDATAVDDMLLVASESLVINDGAVVQIDAVAIEEIAVSDVVREESNPSKQRTGMKVAGISTPA